MGIPLWGKFIPKIRNFCDFALHQPIFYIYYVEICTNLEIISNASTTQNFVRIVQGIGLLHGLPVLYCLGGEALISSLVLYVVHTLTDRQTDRQRDRQRQKLAVLIKRYRCQLSPILACSVRSPEIIRMRSSLVVSCNKQVTTVVKTAPAQYSLVVHRV